MMTAPNNNVYLKAAEKGDIQNSHHKNNSKCVKWRVDRTWSIVERKDKPLQYSCQENPMNRVKGKKIWHWKMIPQVRKCPMGKEWRVITNSSRKNEVAGPKLKWLSGMDVSCAESKVQCYKEQYCQAT